MVFSSVAYKTGPQMILLLIFERLRLPVVTNESPLEQHTGPDHLNALLDRAY
jgi:hypothetical protein